MLPLLAERVEASAAAKVAFLTIVGHEFVTPPAPEVETPCNDIVPICPTGFGVDPATRTCVECTSDVVVDWTDVACFTLSSVPISSQSSAGDTCPEQFWVEVRNLTSRPPGTSFKAHVRLSLPQPACDGTKVAIGLYGRQPSGTHTEFDTSNSIASYLPEFECSLQEDGTSQSGTSIPVSNLDAGDALRIWTVIDPDVGDEAAHLRMLTTNDCPN
jgi:hypothetical protein